MNLKELSHSKRLQALEHEISAHTNFLVMMDLYIKTLEQALIDAKCVTPDALNVIRKKVLQAKPVEPKIEVIK